MKKAYNFNAGPCVLPKEVIESTIEAIRNFDNTGIGLLEISHRTPGWERIMAETEQLWRDLLDIPQEYAVIFLGGGASTQFFEVPANFLNKKAAYLQTGVWAKKAIKEAKFYGEVEVVASSEDKTYSYIPKNYTIPADADYFHITTNNTIYGTELREDPNVAVPLVADMSSDIFSRRIDVSKYDAIYAGAQKNLAPSGVTLVIVKEDALGKVDRAIPTMLDYRTHVEKGSMFNTPPVVPIYCMLENLRWIKKNGGVEAMAKRAQERADIVYGEIDRNKLFRGTVEAEDRSLMNVPFVTGNEELDAKFVKEAKAAGFENLKGHRTVGGMRASIYNAMPKEGVEKLVEFMKKFEEENA